MRLPDRRGIVAGNARSDVVAEPYYGIFPLDDVLYVCWVRPIVKSFPLFHGSSGVLFAGRAGPASYALKMGLSQGVCP